MAAKKSGRKLTMLTAYDAPTAEILEKAGIDMILVGDSLGMVVLGYPTTRPVTMDEMIHHAKAVRRGAKKSFIIGDLPLLGVEKGPKQALLSARRFIEEAGCDAVKVEWMPARRPTVDLLICKGIPVMGHVGLAPQTVKSKKGFGVRGGKAQEARDIFNAALGLERAGIFSLLIECVPMSLARAITESLKIPTIGIGAGPDCDGQVLVFHDIVGFFSRFTPRFVKRYADLGGAFEKAVLNFKKDVVEKRFPKGKHSFQMAPSEWRRFQEIKGR